MTTWNAQSMQAAWFLQGWSAMTPVEKIYDALVGSAPASSQSNPGGVSTATGTDGQQIYRVQLQPSRVDFFINPAPASGVAVPFFADLTASLADFKARLSRGCHQIGSVNRLAIVVNTALTAASAHAASDMVLSKLQISLPFDDGDDIIFQINRKKQLAGFPNVQINRLMKWLSGNFQQVTVTAGGISQTGSPIALMSADVNLVPQTAIAFPPDDQEKIFDELCDEAERLCKANLPAALL